MKKFYIVILVFLALLATIVAGWNYAYPSGTWRYKITVKVETPEGVKSGSAVREVHVTSAGPLEAIPNVTASKKVQGEAVVINLGKYGTMFALKDTDDYKLVFHTFPVPSKEHRVGGGASEGIRYYRSLKKTEPRLLNISLYPKFVNFKNAKDAKSIIILDKNNISQIFGKNIKIKDITLQITDEPVTDIIENYLPEFEESFWEWFKSLKYGDPRRVGPNNFN